MDSITFHSVALPDGRSFVVHPSPVEGVAIVRGPTADYRLVATRPFAADVRLFELDGRIVPKPTRYSVQTGPGAHLDPGSWCGPDEIIERYFWRFMNHSCDPCVHLRDRTAITRRAIAAWDDFTFDYLTTEDELTSPFDCHCGSPLCVGRVRGYRHLAPDERARRRPYLAEHLRALDATAA